MDLGFRHAEQIDLLQKIQQQLLNSQSFYLKGTDDNFCQKCGSKLYKSGYVKSDFHSIFTDHKVAVRRQICKSCKWTSIPSIRSLFGNAAHPDLVKLQCETGANRTYRDAQALLNRVANTDLLITMMESSV